MHDPWTIRMRARLDAAIARRRGRALPEGGTLTRLIVGEALLLAEGSRLADLWGANYFPGLGLLHCIEFTALINIRPAQGNRSMEIQDPAVCESVRDIVHDLIGSGEPL
jgi:hypothetical protein